MALLRLIAVAAEERLPLGPLLEAWAADERGVQERRLRRLIRLLNKGAPLPDAVEQVRGVLRDEDVLAIRFGVQSGALAASVRDLLDESQPNAADGTTGIRDRLFYFLVVLLFATPVVTFISIKIAPEFEKILDEFSMDQPLVVQWSRQLNEFVVNYWWIGAILGVVALWLLFSARTGRYVRHAMFRRLFRPLRELRSAEILQKLSLATHAGRPVAGALSTLARYHFDPTVRRKLLYVRNEVEQGTEVWQSMAAVDLLTAPEQRVLETADRVGNRTWALRQLAATKKRRTSRHLQRVADLLLPALVLVMGAFVLFQALTVFVPLTEMIWALV